MVGGTYLEYIVHVDKTWGKPNTMYIIPTYVNIYVWGLICCL